MSIKEKYNEVKKEYIKEYSDKFWNQNALWKFEILLSNNQVRFRNILWGKLKELLPPYQMAGIFGATVRVTFLSSKNPFNEIIEVSNDVLSSNIDISLPIELTFDEKMMMFDNLSEYQWPFIIKLSDLNENCKNLRLELEQAFCQDFVANKNSEPFNI